MIFNSRICFCNFSLSLYIYIYLYMCFFIVLNPFNKWNRTCPRQMLACVVGCRKYVLMVSPSACWCTQHSVTPWVRTIWRPTTQASISWGFFRIRWFTSSAETTGLRSRTSFVFHRKTQRNYIAWYSSLDALLSPQCSPSSRLLGSFFLGLNSRLLCLNSHMPVVSFFNQAITDWQLVVTKHQAEIYPCKYCAKKKKHFRLRVAFGVANQR